MANSAIKPYKGMAMEGVVARWYARNTARDRSRFESVARSICQRVPPSDQILEVAPGPGYLAIELAKSGRKVAALDISKSFVEMVETQREGGRRRSRCPPRQRVGDAVSRGVLRLRRLHGSLQELYRAGGGD